MYASRRFLLGRKATRKKLPVKKLSVDRPFVGLDQHARAGALGTRDVIVSVDLGEKNFAYCLMDKSSSEIIKWSRLNLDSDGVKTSNIESVFEFFESFVHSIPGKVVSKGPVGVDVASTVAKAPASAPPFRAMVPGAVSAGGVGSSSSCKSASSSSSSSSSPIWWSMSPPPITTAASNHSCYSSSPRQQSSLVAPVLSRESVVLIENQMGSRLRAMQAICFSLFKSMTDAETLMAYPRRVHSHFGFGGQGSWHANKRASIEHCERALVREAVQPKWRRFFAQSSKQDDLADCYLQALWFFESNGGGSLQQPTEPAAIIKKTGSVGSKKKKL